MPSAGSVHALQDDLVRLSADADKLVRAIEEELGRGAAPWAAMRTELEERILPLSLKDGVVSPSERRLAVLDRQRVRLLREAAVLREAQQAVAQRLADIQERWDVVAHHSARLRKWSLLARQQHQATAAWSQEVSEYCRRWRTLHGGR